MTVEEYENIGTQLSRKFFVSKKQKLYSKDSLDTLCLSYSEKALELTYGSYEQLVKVLTVLDIMAAFFPRCKVSKEALIKKFK